MSRHSTSRILLLLALVFGLAGGAQATSFDLGTISGPGSYAIGNSKDLRPFTDRVHFTIASGVTLIFSATAENDTWRHGGIYDMDGTLSDDFGAIQEADAALVNPPYPYPARLVTFESIVLGPGHYFISLFGNSQSDVMAGPNDYFGSVQFAATPLPASLLLMLTALGGFGLLGWRRNRKST